MLPRWTRTKAFLRARRSLIVWVPLVLLIQNDVVTLMSVTGRSMSVSPAPRQLDLNCPAAQQKIYMHTRSSRR